MGCFSVSCMASGISMYTSPACIIPLKKSKYADSAYEFGKSIVSNDGSSALFEPIALPVFGNLDSYGRLENIVRDKNVEVLEEYHKKSIEDYLENITGTYVHEEIYYALSGNPDQSAYEEAYNTPACLKFFGFKFEKEVKRERYDELYINPDYPNMKLYSDGTYIEVEIDDKKVQAYIFTIKDFVKFLDKHSNKKISKKIIGELKQMPQCYFTYDEAAEKIKEPNILKQLKFDKGEITKEQFETLEIGDTIFCDIYGLVLSKTPYKVDETIAIYNKHYDNPEIKDAIMRLKTFSMSLFLCNKCWMPSFSGPQFGYYKTEKLLHTTALKIINEHIKQEKEWDKE